MKLQIIQDPNNFLKRLFPSGNGFYLSLETGVKLYLEYGENIKWFWDPEDETFNVFRNRDYVAEYTRDEWKKFLKQRSISLTNNKKFIIIKTDEEFTKKFLDLLHELDIVFVATEPDKLSKIMWPETV